MDQEMNFPNPVERTDLPTRKRRWPKVLIACGVVFVAGGVFFPQLVSSKLGRKFVVSYIASRTNSAVTLESIKTSWFGGTEFRFLMLKDPLGRRISVSHLACGASLPKLLRGKYDLGDAVVNGLYMDYVIDDGRGVDTFERMSPKPPAPAGGADAAAPAAPLPRVSGNIKINNATLVLWRGTVLPKFYEVDWQNARLDNVNATFTIDALDKPWTYTFAATVTEEEQPPGTLTSSGTVDLGAAGRPDAGEMAVDATLSGTDVRTGPLGAALIPAATRDEVRQVFGPVLNKFDVAVKAADGTVRFERCEGQGPDARFRIQPVIDTNAIPATVSLLTPGAISVGVSKRLGSDWLVYLHPFFREAAGGQGNVSFAVESFRLPLGPRSAKSFAAKGEMVAKGVALKRQDEMSAAEALPNNLASQVSLLTGDVEQTVALDASGRFSVGGGEIAVGPMTTVLRDFAFVLEGTVDAQTGSLNLTAIPAGASLAAKLPGIGTATPQIPITGTVRQPQLGVLSMKGSLSDDATKAVADRVNEQITRMKSKETKRLMQKSQLQVEDLLRPLQGPGTSTAPATAPQPKP